MILGLLRLLRRLLKNFLRIYEIILRKRYRFLNNELFYCEWVFGVFLL
jgi:hypothetical protein